MENPSLQIGNGKFAIKENELLGYSSSGTRFFPIPITMTRATLGSRVNPSGLVENVALLGSELVSCGDFACADPNAEWTEGTGWTISGGKATHTGATGNLSQDVGIGGKAIFLTFDILSIADGVCNVYDTSNATTYASFSTTGTKTLYFQSVSNSIGFRSNSTNVSIDNISVKEATTDGLARVDYTDGTGSLLVEPQRTNLLTYSEDFSTYTPVGGIVVEGNQTDPNGNNTAYKLSNFAANNSRLDGNTSATAVNGVTYTYSAYYKGSGTIRINCGTSTGVGGSSEKDIILTNEWTRQQVTFTALSPTGVVKTHAAITRAPNNDAIVYLAFAQVEQGSYPTSYIKTQGSTVTRNQDEYTKTGISDKINSEEGVLFAEVAVLSDDSTLKSITLSDSSTANRVIINYSNASNRLTADVRLGGVGQAFMQTFSYTITNFLKIALKYKENDFALWVNGTEVATDTSGSTFTANTLNRLGFDNGGSGELLFSKVRQVQVFKTALSDSELATLTSN